MIKKIFLPLMLLAWLFVGVQAAKANEGRIVLESKGVRCEGISVWRDGQYKVVGKCYGLQYPYKGEYDRYYLWVENAKKDVDVRVVEINRGYFEGFVYNDFSKVFVTAEKTSSPRKPSPFVVMSGKLEAFKMPEGRQEIVMSQSTKAEAKSEVASQGKTAVNQNTNQTNSSVARVFGRIVMSLLIIIVIVIVMVIVGSLIFRKKGSVS